MSARVFSSFSLCILSMYSMHLSRRVVTSRPCFRLRLRDMFLFHFFSACAVTVLEIRRNYVAISAYAHVYPLFNRYWIETLVSLWVNCYFVFLFPSESALPSFSFLSSWFFIFFCFSFFFFSFFFKTVRHDLPQGAGPPFLSIIGLQSLHSRFLNMASANFFASRKFNFFWICLFVSLFFFFGYRWSVFAWERVETLQFRTILFRFITWALAVASDNSDNVVQTSSQWHLYLCFFMRFVSDVTRLSDNSSRAKLAIFCKSDVSFLSAFFGIVLGWFALVLCFFATLTLRWHLLQAFG